MSEKSEKAEIEKIAKRIADLNEKSKEREQEKLDLLQKQLKQYQSIAGEVGKNFQIIQQKEIELQQAKLDKLDLEKQIKTAINGLTEKQIGDAAASLRHALHRWVRRTTSDHPWGR